MDIRLDGKVALVTGASKGIGKAIAAAMVHSGAQVMLVSRKPDQLDAAAAEIGADHPGAVATFPANAGDPEAGRRAVAATIERFGALDILVNNAATNPYYGPLLGVDESRFDKTFQVNIRGPVFWSQAAWEQAFQHRPGVILNIASIGGVRGGPALGVYNLTKAALVLFTRQLAAEIGPTRVVGLAPGLIETDFSGVLVETYGEAMAARNPTRRLGQPADVAAFACFLVSDAAGWLTGDTYPMDGGAGLVGLA
jgi:NAD(P)-dependent dehydrogenase (short-subunit alcohol dehydrogenase family)